MNQLRTVTVGWCALALIAFAACTPKEQHKDPIKGITVINDFDSGHSTMSDLEVAIDKAASGGATDVRFPTGEWHWYCPSCACNEWHDLPTKGTMAKLEDSADRITTENVVEWLGANRIKGVELYFDPRLPSEKFFQVERLLRERGIKYWVFTTAKPGTMAIQETYMRSPSLPINQEVEQPGPAQPATQPADKVPPKDQPPTPTSEDAPR